MILWRVLSLTPFEGFLCFLLQISNNSRSNLLRASLNLFLRKLSDLRTHILHTSISSPQRWLATGTPLLEKRQKVFRGLKHPIKGHLRRRWMARYDLHIYFCTPCWFFCDWETFNSFCEKFMTIWVHQYFGPSSSAFDRPESENKHT